MRRKQLLCWLFDRQWAYMANGCKVCERCTALTTYQQKQPVQGSCLSCPNRDPRIAREVAYSEITHMCPEGSEATFPCCGRFVQESFGSRMTLDPKLVTCPGRRPPTSESGVSAGPDGRR